MANVLLILTDQQRADCLGAAAHPDLKTPALDRIADDGVYYTRTWCTTPLCGPSRYSIFSGLYTGQHHCWGNQATLAQEFETIPRALKRAGYRTATVGKMHLHPTYLDIGFDSMMLAEQAGKGRFDCDYHRELKDAGLADLIDFLDQEKPYRERAPQEYWDTLGTMTSDLPEGWHSTDWIGSRALEALEDWSNHEKNFLTVSFIKPHHPFDTDSRWADAYDPGLLELIPGYTEQCSDRDLAANCGHFPHNSWNESQLRKVMTNYYANISHIDSWVGRMLDLLNEKDLYDDTLIVFASDHGEYLGYHHMLTKCNYPYESVLQVPLLIKYPGGKRSGEKDGRLVSLVDLAPTILRAMDAPSKARFPGNDLADTEWDRGYVCSEYAGGKVYAVRDERYKLIRCSNGWETLLFDLEDDPFEMDNLFNDPGFQYIREHLQTALAKWKLEDCKGYTLSNEQAPLSPGDNVCSPGDAESQATRDWINTKFYERY